MAKFFRTLLAAGFLSTGLFAQNYTFLRVEGDGYQRPDGAGAFGINVNTRPSIEGQYVLFRDGGGFGSQNAQTIWSHNLNDGTFTKLMDQNTPVPGGTGNFSDIIFDSSPVLKNGIVTFLARDQKTPPFNQGIYSVPIAGGKISRVANYNTADPSGGTFRQFDTASKQYGGFTLDQKVAFNGNNDPNVSGVYTANADGSSVVRIADALHPVKPNSVFPISIFYNPWINGNTVLFFGQSVFDASTGFIALYTCPSTGPSGTLPDGSPNYVEVVNSDTPLPGNPNSKFHTRFGMGIALEGSTVAFIADDSNTTGSSYYRGIFATNSIGGTLTRVVAPGVSLPGLGVLDPLSSYGSFSLNQGRILFRAQDTTPGSPGNHGLYLWQNGIITRIVGTGDILDGRKVNEVFDVGPYALSGDKMVFLVGLAGYGFAMYVAQPPDPSIKINAVTNGANYSSQSISPGEIVTIFGQNMGPGTLTGFSLSSANRVPGSIANARFLVNGNQAPPIYVRADQASAILPFSLNEDSASVVAVYNGKASVPFKIPVSNTTAGLFSSDSTGAGQGAVLNQNGSVNSLANPAPKGSTIVLFGTGHGVTNPNMVEGQVTPTTSIPQLFVNTTVTVGGSPAQFSYSGPAPGLVAGVWQVNVVIPAAAGSGPQPVVVKLGNDSSQTNLTVAVQ